MCIRRYNDRWVITTALRIPRASLLNTAHFQNMQQYIPQYWLHTPMSKDNCSKSLCNAGCFWLLDIVTSFILKLIHAQDCNKTSWEKSRKEFSFAVFTKSVGFSFINVFRVCYILFQMEISFSQVWIIQNWKARLFVYFFPSPTPIRPLKATGWTVYHQIFCSWIMVLSVIKGQHHDFLAYIRNLTEVYGKIPFVYHESLPFGMS